MNDNRALETVYSAGKTARQDDVLEVSQSYKGSCNRSILLVPGHGLMRSEKTLYLKADE